MNVFIVIITFIPIGVLWKYQVWKIIKSKDLNLLLFFQYEYSVLQKKIDAWVFFEILCFKFQLEG